MNQFYAYLDHKIMPYPKGLTCAMPLWSMAGKEVFF